LNLPKRSGQQVLQEIKQDVQLRQIPVLVLTTSQSSEDVSSAYDLQANCYIRKPMDLPQFWEVVRSIEQFWLTTATLPQARRAL
jgi:two-component system, chemotaxis family, response regulator Rcp1